MQKNLREDNKAKSKSFFLKKDGEIFDKGLLGFLIKFNLKYKKDVRICMHKNKKENHHDMIILQQKGNFYPPHKHLKKGETYHIIKGSMVCVLFNKFGKITKYSHIKKNNIFRTPKNVYHTIIPYSKKVIYHESKIGPFLKKNDSIFPKWSRSPLINKNIDLIVKRIKGKL